MSSLCNNVRLTLQTYCIHRSLASKRCSCEPQTREFQSYRTLLLVTVAQLYSSIEHSCTRQCPGRLGWRQTMGVVLSLLQPFSACFHCPLLFWHTILTYKVRVRLTYFWCMMTQDYIHLCPGVTICATIVAPQISFALWPLCPWKTVQLVDVSDIYALQIWLP